MTALRSLHTTNRERKRYCCQWRSLGHICHDRNYYADVLLLHSMIVCSPTHRLRDAFDFLWAVRWFSSCHLWHDIHASAPFRYINAIYWYNWFKMCAKRTTICRHQSHHVWARERDQDHDTPSRHFLCITHSINIVMRRMMVMIIILPDAVLHGWLTCSVFIESCMCLMRSTDTRP